MSIDTLQNIIFPLFWAVVATGIFAFIRNYIYAPIAREKELKKAIEQGHVVVAKREKAGTNVLSESMPDRHRYDAVYLYEVNGKVYRYKVGSNMEPPEQLELYYQHNPAKAKIKSSFGTFEGNYLVVFFVISVLMFLFR